MRTLFLSYVKSKALHSAHVQFTISHFAHVNFTFLHIYGRIFTWRLTLQLYAKAKIHVDSYSLRSEEIMPVF